LKPALQLLVGRSFDHLGQGFKDLVLRVVNVLQRVQEQIVHLPDVFREQSDCEPPFFNPACAGVVGMLPKRLGFAAVPLDGARGSARSCRAHATTFFNHDGPSKTRSEAH